MNSQRLCVWCGIFAAVIIGVALWPLMGFLPPPKPSSGAAEIAARFRDNQWGILIGGTLMVGAFSMLAPFYAVISTQIERIDGVGSTLAKAQLALGVVVVCIPGAVGSTFWTAAAFRPERSDEIIQLLNDLGWMIIFMPVIGGLLQVGALGLAVFQDRSPAPVFPRWFAWFNVWMGVAFLPGGFLAFFKTGAFAWSGLFCYWLGLGAFGLWFMVTARMLLKATR